MITTTLTSTIVSSEAIVGLSLIGIVLLVALLIAKELVAVLDHPVAKRLTSLLNIATVPLLLMFVVVTASKVLKVLL